jgi:hypothetical protein
MNVVSFEYIMRKTNPIASAARPVRRPAARIAIMVSMVVKPIVAARYRAIT